jgi:hypothetical protein
MIITAGIPGFLPGISRCVIGIFYVPDEIIIFQAE